MSLLIQVKLKILQILSRALLLLLLERERLERKRKQQQEQDRKKIPRTAQDRYPVRPGFAPPEPSANRGGKILVNDFYAGTMTYDAGKRRFYVLNGDKTKGWDLGMNYSYDIAAPFPSSPLPYAFTITVIHDVLSLVVLPVGRDHATVSVRVQSQRKHYHYFNLWSYEYTYGTLEIPPYTKPPLPSGCGSGPRLGEEMGTTYFPWTASTPVSDPRNFLPELVAAYSVVDQQSWLVSRKNVKQISTPSGVESLLLELNPAATLSSGLVYSGDLMISGSSEGYQVDLIAQPCGLLEAKSMRQDPTGPFAVAPMIGGTGWTPPTPRPSLYLPRYEKVQTFGLVPAYTFTVTPGVYTVISDPEACDGLSTYEAAGSLLQTAGAPLPGRWVRSLANPDEPNITLQAHTAPYTDPLPPPVDRYRRQETPKTVSTDFPHPNFTTWDWGRPGYCRAQAFALGFAGDDLVFAADP
jgi:hypothetical protein